MVPVMPWKPDLLRHAVPPFLLKMHLVKGLGCPNLHVKATCTAMTHCPRQHRPSPATGWRAHGLHWQKSPSCYPRHQGISGFSQDFGKLGTIAGICWSDGKQPDRTMPWKSRQILIWDAICRDTFAPSYNIYNITLTHIIYMQLAKWQAGALAGQTGDQLCWVGCHTPLLYLYQDHECM